ncbi:MAG: hypothetical protein AB7S26_43015 [Sandaracinaceae bacterium]
MRKRSVRAFDYVNHPYERVRDAVRAEPLALFARATKAAAARSEDVATALSVDLAGIEISRDVDIQIRGVSEDAGKGELHRSTHVALAWSASESARLFPLMEAELRVYPLSHTETEIELVGEYEPPLGALGAVIDAAVGHRIAEASVHRLVRSVVEHLRTDLKES